jgi:acyl-CoA synthetase (AMP-forming)/AMP-acid ligase II
MYIGRLDDVLVLGTGLKINPVDIEIRLQAHSALSGCLVFGNGYARCEILLEAKKPGETQLVERVWEAIEEANLTVLEHARIDRSFVVVADPALPFVRASKGTIVRKLTTALYVKNITEIYRANGLKHLVRGE